MPTLFVLLEKAFEIEELILLVCTYARTYFLKKKKKKGSKNDAFLSVFWLVWYPKDMVKQ
jgi:hypothetical protein